MHEFLIALNKKSKPVHGKINKLVNEFNVNRKTIIRIWASIKQHQIVGQSLLSTRSDREFMSFNSNTASTRRSVVRRQVWVEYIRSGG